MSTTESDQPVWNTVTLYGCRVQPSASAIQKKTYTQRRTWMHWHHDVHKQCIGADLCIMHCRVGKKHWGYSKTGYPGVSCLPHATSVHWPRRHGRTKPSLHYSCIIAIAAACMGSGACMYAVLCHFHLFTGRPNIRPNICPYWHVPNLHIIMRRNKW
jgi:hypothetical protein